MARVAVGFQAGAIIRQTPAFSTYSVTTRDAHAWPEVYFPRVGWVSFERPPDGEPGELRASADFTDVTAEDNPQWKIDLSDDVIGTWHAEGDRGGDITLVWGLPMVRGAVQITTDGSPMV